jgi:HAUS augmin-like complex subunit 1
MAHLSPSAIFSPSIAKQQQAALNDWSYIDTWLSQKFPKNKTPPFERNADTLKALLALAAHNESADEERDLLARVEAQALADLQATAEADTNTHLLHELEESLTREGHASLDVLAELTVQLGLAVPDVEQMGRRIVDLQITAYDLEQASGRVALLEKHLSAELERITALVTELQGEGYQPPANLAKQTIDYQRKTKVLASKLPELRDRVAAYQASVGGTCKITIEVAKEEEDMFRNMLATIKELEMQVKGYHGLPQDTDLARLELESLRVELRDLTQQRDSMFEGLVERETPRKPRS